MADFKFTQTGAQIQAILNKAAALPEHLYKHSIIIDTDASGSQTPSKIFYEFYSTSGTAFTTWSSLKEYLLDNDLVKTNGVSISGIKFSSTAGGSALGIYVYMKRSGSDIAIHGRQVSDWQDIAYGITSLGSTNTVTDDVSQIY